MARGADAPQLALFRLLCAVSLRVITATATIPIVATNAITHRVLIVTSLVVAGRPCAFWMALVR